MACKYYDNRNGKEYNSIQDLIHDFYVNNYELKNAAIFSADEIQDSTVNKILKIKDINTFGDSNKTPITQYITDPNPLLAMLPGFGNQDRLAPEYIEKNRIYQYVTSRIDALGTKDITGLEYDPKKLEDLKAEGNLSEANENKLIFLLSEIEGIIKHEEKTKDFGTFLHNLVSLKVLGNKTTYDNKMTSFITDPKNKEIFGDYSPTE